MFNIEQSLFGFLGDSISGSPFLSILTVFFAEFLPYVLVAGVLVYLLKFRGDTRTRIYRILLVLLTILLSRGFFTETIRFFFPYPRPYHMLGFSPVFTESTSAFPSGHMAFLFAIAIPLLFFSRRWGAWFLGASLMVGLARILAGVHWPMDILGGIVVAGVSYEIIRRILPSPPRSVPSPEEPEEESKEA